MEITSRPSFQAALATYCRARKWLETKTSEIDLLRAMDRIDRALDIFIATPSPSIGAFGSKMKILEAEYGLDAQPRHMKSLYADVAGLAALYAGVIAPLLPGG